MLRATESAKEINKIAIFIWILSLNHVNFVDVHVNF